MAKKVSGIIKLQVPAGKANPAPPIGPALGQRGLNIMEFCKSFNAKTQSMESGMPVPVIITAFSDKSFTYTIKNPPASFLIKKAVGIQKGACKPKKDQMVTLTRLQIRDIANKKISDLTGSDLEASMRSIEGSARSMGIFVQES